MPVAARLALATPHPPADLRTSQTIPLPPPLGRFRASVVLIHPFQRSSTTILRPSRPPAQVQTDSTDRGTGRSVRCVVRRGYNDLRHAG